MGESERDKDITIDGLVRTGVENQAKQATGRIKKLQALDIGEQVIGSEHTFSFPSPVNGDEHYGAVGTAAVMWPGFSTNWNDVSLAPGGVGRDLKITFKPQSKAPIGAVLHYSFTWMDGHKEDHYVKVTARARDLDDVPAGHQLPPPARGSAATNLSPSDQDHTPSTMEREAHRNSAAAHYQALVAAQLRGVNVAEKEVEKFKPPPTTEPLWWQLAEIALMMGTVHFAAIAAKLVSSGLITLAGKLKGTIRSSVQLGREGTDWSVPKPRSSSAVTHEDGSISVSPGPKAPPPATISHEDGSLSVSSGSRSAPGSPEVKPSHEDDVSSSSEHHHSLRELNAEGLTAAVEEGIKKGVEKGIAKVKPSEAAEGTPGGRYSADPTVNFFETQRSMLAAASSFGVDEVIQLVTSLYQDYGDDADKLTDVMRTAYAAAAATATPFQANETALQFYAYKARAGLGSEVLHTKSGDIEVTKMDALRKGGRSKLDIAPLTSGVLEIAASQDPSGEISVVGAQMHDVAALTADRSLSVDLRTSGIPIRIVMYNMTVITIDEAGRVRMSGAPLNILAQVVDHRNLATWASINRRFRWKAWNVSVSLASR